MGIYKINLEGGFSHIIKTDNKVTYRDVVETLFQSHPERNVISDWELYTPNNYKQDSVTINSNKVVSIEYCKED